MASTIKCIFHPCSGRINDLNKYKELGIKKNILCSKDKGDNIHVKLEHILNCVDQESMIWSHKSCYCSYTSSSRNTPVKSKQAIKNAEVLALVASHKKITKNTFIYKNFFKYFFHIFQKVLEEFGSAYNILFIIIKNLTFFKNTFSIPK